MPQMMPLNWIILMIYFLMLFNLINIFLYFNFNKNLNFMIKKSYKKHLNWKW